MKRIFLLLTLIFSSPLLYSFCGFYVSKADGSLKNKTSQVIMVRDDNRTVITMYNDFKGDVKDFAMVVPVPVVLQKSDIKVVSNNIFKSLNDYSAPRLVEYYDDNPCEVRKTEEKAFAPRDMMVMNTDATVKRKSNGVTIEATYTVGEYDILILSAKESAGLKTWLSDNGYKIPSGAEEVLDPYIKSNLKFFVVKVNIKEKEKAGHDNLRPIQIRFNSPKFMLPIRLGMANADGDQDMIVYAFTKKGRVESTNYRTVSVPTGKNIPLFVKNDFSSFYSSLFQNQWRREEKSVAFLEYAWDVSPSNYVKCDPCVSDPPDYSVLKESGVWWLGKDSYNDYVNEYESERGKVFFTRLHIRYNRRSFPQDLSFQVTPNTENFQARYIIRHPATGDLTCAAGIKYIKSLRNRRITEMEMLSSLTGKFYDQWNVSINEDDMNNIPELASYTSASKAMLKRQALTLETPPKEIMFASVLLLGVVVLLSRRSVTSWPPK